jgi:endopeptidase La
MSKNHDNIDNVTNNEITLYYLHNDYEKRTIIINNLSSHIEKMYDNYLITIDDRKKAITMISDILNQMNIYYNKYILNINPELKNTKNNNDHDNEYIDNKTNNTNISNNSSNNIHNDNDNDNDDNDSEIKIYSGNNKLCRRSEVKSTLKIIDILRKNNTLETFVKDLNLADFNNIDKSLRKLSNFVGMNNLEELLYLYKFDQTHLSVEDTQKIKLLSKILIPFSCKFIESKRIDKKNLYLEFIENKESSDKYELQLDNLYILKLRTADYKYVLEINCILDKDSVNIHVRTSQIVYPFLYERKKEIVEIINKLPIVNKLFKESYIKNLSLGEYLINNKNDFKKKVTDDYCFYIKYSNMNFKSIMSEFLQVSLKMKFEIIKFLLMGNSSTINIAALLYGITKDQRDSIDSNSKPTLISDIIYRNLKFANQIKLKKSNSIIQQELDRLKNISVDDIDLKKQIIIHKNMPAYVKKIALNRFEELKSGSSEHYKQQLYIKKLIDFPWPSEDEEDKFSLIKNDPKTCKEFILDAKNKMNSTVYGHDKCKETIIELIGKWISNPKSTGKSIGLQGPPGVGKTLFAKALGKILNIPFSQLNVGGVDDASILTGHSFTYSSAQNGIIIDNMIQGQSPRCVMFFDEIDKTGIKHGVNEIMNVLIHLTDPNTNDKFNDKFFQEVTFPLDKVLFVFSYNDTSKVDKILLDRLEQINVDAYNTNDKIEIFKKHLLKEVTSDINLDPDMFLYDDDTLTYLIETYTHEAGVRGLKRKIEKLMYKINLEKLYGEIDLNNKIKITKELIDKYLEKPTSVPKRVFPSHEVGVINGMYATTGGPGGILPILIYKNFTGSKFKLRLTGQQKSVMKESIKFSFTIAINLLKEKWVTEFMNTHKYGLHIHTPDGSTPKDGPSAGGAFTSAFISRILQKKIKNNIAMTGEIETHGNLTAIGGLEQKLMGAKKAGVKFVFIPKENEEDYNKIEKKNLTLMDDNFRVKIVEHITELLEYILIDDTIVARLNKENKDITYEKTFDMKDYIK